MRTLEDFNIKQSSCICDCMIDLCVAWRARDYVVHIDDDD